MNNWEQVGKYEFLFNGPDMLLEHDPRRTANFLRDCEAHTTIGVIFKPPLSFSVAIVIWAVLTFVDAVVWGGLNKRHHTSGFSLPINL